MLHRPSETRKKKARVDASPSRKARAKPPVRPSKNVVKGDERAEALELGKRLAGFREHLELIQEDVGHETGLGAFQGVLGELAPRGHPEVRRSLPLLGSDAGRVASPRTPREGMLRNMQTSVGPGAEASR